MPLLEFPHMKKLKIIHLAEEDFRQEEAAAVPSVEAVAGGGFR